MRRLKALSKMCIYEDWAQRVKKKRGLLICMRHFDEITVSNGEIREMGEAENNKKVKK